jgi:hypothetical protein
MRRLAGSTNGRAGFRHLRACSRHRILNTPKGSKSRCDALLGAQAERFAA